MLDSLLFGYIFGTILAVAVGGAILLWLLPWLMPMISIIVGLILSGLVLKYFAGLDEKERKEKYNKEAAEYKAQKKIEHDTKLKEEQDRLWEENFGNAYKKE